ncbi:PH domain-containing protein [Actinomyces bowdenii]|uniref:PH domain-containing protein n=1 Tax=Actinomyces bowdenii TaxID=131109 RepID=UPI001ABC8ECB|nr:PH domain-containing protein [Actinomyces bowdenii]
MSEQAHPRSTGAGRRQRQARRIELPQDVTWQRVSLITPLLEGWKIATGIMAFVTVQNLDEIIEAYRFVRRHGTVVGDYLLYFLLGVLLLVLGWAAIGLLSWHRRSYAVDAHGVYLRTGVLFRQLRTARLPRIQSVDVVHPLLGRILGLGQLTVEVAGGKDSRVVIGYLRTWQLEALRDRILVLAAGAQEEPQEGAGEARVLPGAAGPHGGAAPVDGAAAGGLDAVEAPPQDRRPGAPVGPGLAGFEEAAAAPRLASPVRVEEHPLYQVGTGMLLASMLRSGSLVAGCLLLLLLVLGAVGAVVLGGLRPGLSSWGGMLSVLAAPVGVITMLWGRFNRGWGFRAAATPSGIRMRYGLTSEVSRTLPPGRVHAVGLSQPLLWRSRDWWAVGASVAGREKGQEEAGESGSKNALLPVGARATALRALWLVVPDLGAPDPDGLLRSALLGAGDDGVGDPAAPMGSPERGFVRISPRGRLFSPLAWRRQALALTRTCVIIRDGRWHRRVSVVPYERIQSLSVTQGPWARRRAMARIRLDMVATDVPTSLANLRAEDARALAAEISRRALRRRSEERLDRWLSRAAGGPGAVAEPRETIGP